MVSRSGERRLVLFVYGLISIAAARQRTLSQASSSELSRRKSAAGVIPSWKLDMGMNPETLYVKRALQMRVEGAASSAADSSVSSADGVTSVEGSSSAASDTSDASGATPTADTPASSAGTSGDTVTTAPAAAGSPFSGDVDGHEDAYVGTDGQDTQACPVLKLPGLMHLETKSTSWTRRSGNMENPNSVSMASWTQNLLSQQWNTLYLHDVDGKLALKATPTDQDTLSRNYDWTPKNLSTSFELYSMYKKDLRQRASWVAEPDTAKTWVVLLDCAGALLFVFCLQAGEPGHTDIYDRNGYFIAHSLNDPTVARYQWIDTNGHLLATAESPGLWQNIPREHMPTDDARGGILFYELGYEKGGYQHASRLMDLEYRWVIVSAMQVNAVYEAEDGWVPNAQIFMAVATACCAALGAVILLCGCYFIYRIVYPSPSMLITSYDGGPHWAKAVNPFMWVPDARTSGRKNMASFGY